MGRRERDDQGRGRWLKAEFFDVQGGAEAGLKMQNHGLVGFETSCWRQKISTESPRQPSFL